MQQCDFCGSSIPYETTQCPSCGAQCEFILKPESSKGNDVTKGDSNSISSAKRHVVSMEDVKIPSKVKHRQNSFDDLESELKQVRRANSNKAQKNILICFVILIILIFLGSCFV